MLDGYLRVLDLASEPLPALLDMDSPVQRTVWTPWGPAWSRVAIPNWRMGLGRVRAVGGLRELARCALRLRIERLESDPDAADPLSHLEQPADEAFLGLPLVVEENEQAGLELTLDGAPELWARMVRNVQGEMAYEWTVP